MLRTLAREAALAVGAEIAGVYLGNARDGRRRAPRATTCADEWHGIVLAPGEGAAGQVLRTGRTFVTNDYQRDTTVPQPSLRGFRTAVAVPMVWNDELKGALSVGWTTLRRVEEEDRARSRRSPTSPPSPATTPRPTTRSSRPRAPTR